MYVAHADFILQIKYGLKMYVAHIIFHYEN